MGRFINHFNQVSKVNTHYVHFPVLPVIFFYFRLKYYWFQNPQLVQITFKIRQLTVPSLETRANLLPYVVLLHLQYT